MNKRALSIPILFLLCGLFVSIILLSLAPPVSKDELVHHLAIPKLYLKNGGVYEIPFMTFSYYPMNLDLLYLIPLYFGNDIAPKFIHFTFAILTGWLIFQYLRRRLNVSYALLGSLFFLSIPIVVKLSTAAYIDLGVVFFSFASLFFILKWIESGFRMRFLVYSAIMCGLGLGTKYNALISLLLFSLLVPFASSRYGGDPIKPSFFRSLTQGLVFLSISLLIFSPWAARNYHWKKNPVYPFYNQLFNPPESSLHNPGSVQNEKNKPGIFALREALYQEKWWDIALLPIRLFFQGKDGDPKYFDGKLNPFLLLFPFFALLRLRKDPAHLKAEKMIFAAFAFLYFFLAFFSFGLRIRYIAPLIPPLVLLAVYGIHRTQEMLSDSRYLRSNVVNMLVFLVIVLAPLSYNAAYVYGQFKVVDPFSYLCGSVTRDEYIARFRPEYPAVLYINRELPEDVLISVIFIGNRGYYLDREYIYGEEQLLLVGKKSEKPEDILVSLKESRITHLLVHGPLFQRWVHDNFPGPSGFIFQRFFMKHTRLLFHDNGFFVFAVD